MKRTLLFLFTVAFMAAGSFSLFAQSVCESRFISLFNGKDLTGWTGDTAVWSVEGGAITGATADEGPAKLKYNTFLIYTGDVPIPSNFVLRFDIKLSDWGNSGMQYRSWVLEGDEPFRVHGYQADFDGSAQYSGICYGEGFRGIIAERGTVSEIGDDHVPSAKVRTASDEELKSSIRIEDWNSYEIIADGFLFIHKINGRVMSILVDNDKEMRRTDGVLAIQAHAGPAMKVQVKNVRIMGL